MIKDFLPDFYNGVYEFDQLAQLEDEQLNLLANDIAKKINNLYVSTADVDGIKDFEKEYQIEDTTGDLETRRRRLLSRLLPPQAITIKFFELLLKNLNLDVKSEIDSVNLIYKAVVDYGSFNLDKINELNQLLDKYVPVNLAKYIYRYQYVDGNMGSYIGIANTYRIYSHADYKGGNN